MQPTPAPAPPPEAPPAPADVSPAVAQGVPTPAAGPLLGDAPIAPAAIPRSVQEVMGLRARRDMLREQIVRAQNRREELVQQLNRPNPDAVKVGIQQRLNLIDERMLQLERDQALTERQITSAPPEVLAGTTEQPSNRGAMMDEDEAVGLAFGTFGAGIVVALVIGRLRRRFARRRAAKLGLKYSATEGAAPLPDDPRIDRLTQAVDAIALEVERIGEGQRFVTQLLSTRERTAALGAESERR